MRQINTENKSAEMIIKGIVRSACGCHRCSERDSCEFWTGCNRPCDCNENCFAEEIEEGICAAYKHLATIPRDEAMNEIVEVYKELRKEE